MRRIPFLEKKYLGNSYKMEVHDLDLEDISAKGCQIYEIIRAGHAARFNPDTLGEAHKCGYDNCAKCLGSSFKQYNRRSSGSVK